MTKNTPPRDRDPMEGIREIIRPDGGRTYIIDPPPQDEDAGDEQEQEAEE